MSNRVESSTIWKVAAAVFVVVLILLLLVGFAVIQSLVFALVLAAAAVAFLLATFGRGLVPPETTTGRVEVAEPARPSPVAAPVMAPPARTLDPEPGIRDAGEAAGMIAPGRLDMPRAGSPDDLKRIKGVGPKLEELLHDMGIFHLDQIAGWGPAEVAWMDANLEGFHGRVTRDDWVGQARLLASGGETEFSRRVDEGDVYH